LARLIPACAENRRARTLWIITKGAMPVSANHESRDPAQTALWSLGQTAAIEHPELSFGLIDLSADDESEEFNALAKTLVKEPQELQFAFRNGAIWVPRLVRCSSDLQANAPLLRPDATYLVTGGTGAIGRDLIRRLLYWGARHLVVVSRRASDSPEFDQLIKQTELAGGCLTFYPADVGNRKQIAAVLRQVRDFHPPLRGLFHLAGELGDGLLRGYDAKRLHRVLEGKARGAENLQQETRDIALEHFVCFSSASAILGSLGLGAYVAANAFLDALVIERKAKGLPGLSIQWGPWGGRGMNDGTSQAQTQGMLGGWQDLNSDKAMDCLGALLATKCTGVVAVVSAEWKVFKHQRPHLEHFFAEVLDEIDESTAIDLPPQETTSLNDHPGRLPPEERRLSLHKQVSDEVRHLLGLSSKQAIDPTRGFADMGMDSIMIVSLRNRLQTALCRNLPATLAYTYSTVDQLSEHLFQLVSGSDSVPIAAPDIAKRAENLGIEEMSDEEIARIIALKHETLSR
jgi:acyl carrier protein